MVPPLARLSVMGRSGDYPHGLSREEIASALTGAGLSDVAVATAFSVPFEGQAMTPLIGHGRKAPVTD